VPCHRVVQSDGGLGGYHWGVERKRRVLDAERKAHGKAARDTGQVDSPSLAAHSD
jgi:alkylated DNA nucleotide flippase Atl1